MTGIFVAGELVLGEQFADFQFDEVEQLGVVDEVDLVEEDDDLGHVDLAGEEDVLAGLGHGAVSGGDDEDGAVHLGGAGDHVLDDSRRGRGSRRGRSGAFRTRIRRGRWRW